jgi:hypothetical protein
MQVFEHIAFWRCEWSPLGDKVTARGLDVTLHQQEERGEGYSEVAMPLACWDLQKKNQ